MSRGITFDHSKGKVNRAGNRLGAGTASAEDLAIIENWRAAHNYVLNTFQATLRTRTRTLKVRSPVQRIKRLNTIKGKLKRFPKMKLARMHDIVGCRVIFEDIASLNEFRLAFNKSRFEHKRKQTKSSSGELGDAYNYINNPKESGYRGIHDVFEYKAKQSGVGKSAGGSRWNGLLVEIQYRTNVQHAWATAVEICDTYTENHGKFSNAPDEYLEYFQLASEILARSHEGLTSCLPNESNKSLVRKFSTLESTHGMLKTLRGIRPSEANFESQKHTLLIYKDDSDTVEVIAFNSFKNAVSEYFRLERETEDDIVLVAADDSESVRFGFKNYFSDAREFVSLIDQGLDLLDE